MTRLVECESCGGLKRAESARCPHCQIEVTQTSSFLKRTLAAASLGAIAACGPNQTPADAYGAVCFADQDSGTCEPYCVECVPAGRDSGPTDSGIGVDAYGIAPLRDAGPLDAGNDED
jgi:hypothetical protein